MKSYDLKLVLPEETQTSRHLDKETYTRISWLPNNKEADCMYVVHLITIFIIAFVMLNIRTL